MLAAINMRVQTVFLLIAVLVCRICFGQQNNKPQILILSPNKVFNYFSSEEIRKENDDMWYEIKCNAATSKHLNTLDSIKNVHVMNELDSENFKNLDILKLPSFISYHYLSFFKQENSLIKYKDEKSNGDTSDLRKISVKYNSQYVLNFTSVTYYSVDFYKEPDRKIAKIEMQLYDRDSNSILVSKRLEGDDSPNSQFIFFSDGETLSCAIKNALATCLEEINSLIFSQSPSLKKLGNAEHKTFKLKLK